MRVKCGKGRLVAVVSCALAAFEPTANRAAMATNVPAANPKRPRSDARLPIVNESAASPSSTKREAGSTNGTNQHTTSTALSKIQSTTFSQARFTICARIGISAAHHSGSTMKMVSP
jgi:hypothetical protein